MAAENKAAQRKEALTAANVFVRIRPEASEGGHAQHGQPAAAKTLQGWDDTGVTVGWTASNTDVGHALSAGSGQRYNFQRVLGPEVSQDEVYDTVVGPLLPKLLGISDGAAANVLPCDVMLLAYGQTGTGKTHTMLGPAPTLREPPADGSINSGWGLFPRIAYNIFRLLETTGRASVVSFSAVEFYLGGATDLLMCNSPVSVSASNEPSGLTQTMLRSVHEVIPALNCALAGRHNRHTTMNLARRSGDSEHGGSSRGHAMLILTVLQLDAAEGTVVSSKLSLVDLAGAERPDKAGGVRTSGEQAFSEVWTYLQAQKEGRETPISIGAQAFCINFELYSLCENCLVATDHNKTRHKRGGRPFKSSTLMETDAVRIVSNAFGGSAVLSVIVTLSQAPQCGWETWFSCTYGQNLSKLRAPVQRRPFVPISKVVKQLQEVIAENGEALKRPVKNKTIKWKRVCAIASAKTSLLLVRELLEKHPLPRFDPANHELFQTPPPVTTGFTFPDSALQNKYTLRGYWDQTSLQDYLSDTLNSAGSTEMVLEFLKIPLAAQRDMLDKMTRNVRHSAPNMHWLQRCPPELMTVDTSEFAPCDNKELQVFVHRPLGVSACSPTVVFAHGGGGVYGRARDNDSHCARLAVENDLVVFNVDYRLAPEARPPAGIFDLVGVILHLRTHAQALGVDPERIAVTGESGGGYLAAGAGMELARRNEQGALRLCLPLHGHVSDLIMRTPPQAVEGGEANLVGWRWMEEQLMPRAGRKQIHYVWINRASDEVLRRFPRTVLVTAEFDLCRRMTEDFGEMLHRHGRLLDLVVHPGHHHCWYWWMTHPQSDMFWGDIRQILATHLIGE